MVRKSKETRTPVLRAEKSGCRARERERLKGERTIPANPGITHGKSRLQTSRCLQVAAQSVGLLENARNGPCVRQRLRGSANRLATSNMKARNYIKLRAASIHAGNANRVLHASVFCPSAPLHPSGCSWNHSDLHRFPTTSFCCDCPAGRIYVAPKWRKIS